MTITRWPSPDFGALGALVALLGITVTVAAQTPPPPPGIQALSTKQVIATLKDLSSWADYSQFKGYFILLPQSNLDLKSSVAQAAANQAQFSWSPYNDPALTLSFRVAPHPMPPGLPPNLIAEYASLTQAMFDPNHGGDQRNAVCMNLDGFGTPVYLPVAERFEAAFIRGLVTRLVLGNYLRAWKLPDHSLNFSTPGPPVPDVSQIIAIPLPQAFSPWQFGPVMIGPGAIAPPRPQTITSTFWEPNQTPFVFTMAIGPTPIFDQFMAIEAYNHPIEPTALMWGWRAGEELDALRGTADESYRKDVISLINARFSPREIGELVGYSLEYLHGFVTNQRVQSMANGTLLPANTDMSAIAVSMNSQAGMPSTDKLVTDLQRVVSLEVYALSQKPNDPSRAAVGASLAFLNGYEEGIVQSADAQFKTITQTAYGTGFIDGWRFGYEQGYAAGYTVGYNQGFGDAWKQASVMLQQLQSSSSQSSGPDAATWITTVLDIGTAIATLE